MIKKDKKILISSALLYVNGLPHLGHMIGCLLPSDFFARYMRARGRDVLYIGGVDFHGSPAELGAKKAGISTLEYCNNFAAQQKEIYDKFELSFDCFGSTHSDENKKIVYDVFDALEKNGFIKEKTVRQMYSKTDGMFLADRFVNGVCPYCGYEKARGDQCEKCEKILEAENLIHPYSAISGATDLEMVDTKHLFLQMQNLQSKLEKWLEDASKNWDKQTAGIARKWINEGLQERSITRDLSWGFPVNRAGFENKVFYVWFDAPFGYLSITKTQNPDLFDAFWNSENADNVEYFQFMGKDNVPFHSVFFPAILLGANDRYKKVDVIKGSSYLNFEGGKFSKSEGRGVFAIDALNELHADYWRYWLLANFPESDDVNFSFDKFAADINKDLNDVLGNFILRIAKFYVKKYGNTVQTIDKNLMQSVHREYDWVIEKSVKLAKSFDDNMQNLHIRKAMEDMRAMWVVGNEFIDIAAPWSLAKTDEKRAEAVLVFSMQLIRIYGLMIAPACPAFADKILSVLSLKISDGFMNFDNFANEFDMLKDGVKLQIPETMFEKITEEQLETFKQKFGGK
ncbi:MAG: methionine--tRNA ligase [Rickettsiales bacterium]|jgi:methionyl-tRNA synthetase|nr:methionine--tRNA ligase [Rickettsiales bacterium]